VAILSLKTRFREFLVGVPVERVLKEMLVPPGAGLVVTALGQLCWAGLLQKSSSDLLPRPQRPADKECEYYARFNLVLHSIFRIAHGLVFASCIVACRFVACQAQRNIRCQFWLKATSLASP
jgi:hypothetical protein